MHVRLRALPILLGLALPACGKSCDALPAAMDDAGAEWPERPVDPLGPPSLADLLTTDGDIAVGNLSAQIDALDAVLRARPKSVGDRQDLVPMLVTRGRFLGRIADAERASAIADELVRDAPKDASVYVTRASTRAAMHLFTAALADLAEAEKHGALPVNLVADRAAILEGQGDLDGALALRRAVREASPNLANLGLEAALLGQMGRAEEAKPLFLRATVDLHSTAAFPVAWLFLQEGLFWERAGEAARAKAFYEAAHDRLPAYGHAASHLAPLVSPALGIEILTPIVAASDDPEFELVLAGRLQAAGRTAEAEVRIGHVRARYAELVARHPEAYAEHAGWFLLDEGKDPARALALARTNLAVRKTEKAYQLAVLAALAAGKRADACALGEEARKLPHASEMLRGVAAGACKQP